MQWFLKITISLAVILAVTQIGRKSPSLAGLVATMPLAGLLALVWLHMDTHGDGPTMSAYTRGALWGIIPSLLFYAAALACFKRQLPLGAVLAISFGVWLTAAAVHQWLAR